MRAGPVFPALAVLALGCGSPTEPSGVEVRFQSELVFGIPTLPTAARVDAGTLIITGVVQTPGTGFNLLGDFSRNGDRLLLEVHAYDNAPGAPFTSQLYYRATVKHLAPGSYDLSVIHSHHAPTPGYSVRVFHDSVRVE